MAGGFTAISGGSCDAEISRFIGGISRDKGGGTTCAYRDNRDIGGISFGDVPGNGLWTGETKGVLTRQQGSLMLTDAQEGNFLQSRGQQGRLQGVLGLAVPYQIGLTVQGEVVLITAEPWLRIGRPSDIDGIRWGMIAAVDDRHRTTLFTEIHLTRFTLEIEIAVDEHSTTAKGAPEGFLSVEVEVAMTIDGRTIQCIVGTLEMAVFIIGILGTIQRIEVQATDETDFICQQAISMNITHMGLCDGTAALGAIELGIQRIDQVDIAVVSQRHILHP